MTLTGDNPSLQEPDIEIAESGRDLLLDIPPDGSDEIRVSP